MADPVTFSDIHTDLLRKYTLRGPRYTSYPTAPEWTESIGPENYRRHIAETNCVRSPASLSLYFHLPFCPKRCYYCGCNVIVTPRHEVTGRYVDLLAMEMDLIAPLLRPDRTVIQLHLGGGTPTHLTPSQLQKLFVDIAKRFSIAPDAERSIEVDVRITTEEHLHVLREFGFNRISFGVQDFSPQVQEAIGRIQTVEQTADFVRLCRQIGFDSINIDLVCGLPHQTAQSVDHTLSEIIRIGPDRIAFYTYGYLPSKMPYQRRIDPGTLPSGDERFAILRSAIERLTQNGYVYIGLDHFSKENDELATAQRQGTLQRNFMGFTTRAGTDLYAFGVSAISSLPAPYVQNTKNLKKYEQLLNDRILPVERGIELTIDDRIRRWVIMELMCNLHIDFTRFRQTWNQDFLTYFHKEIVLLAPYVQDGLLETEFSDEIRVTALGQILVRPIAMTFDTYLTRTRPETKERPTYSHTL